MTTAFAFVDSHIVGVRFSNSVAGGRMTWSAGWFNNWLDDGLSFDESGNIFAGRVTGLPDRAGRGPAPAAPGRVGASTGRRRAGASSSRAFPRSTRRRTSSTPGRFPADERHVRRRRSSPLVEGPVTVSGEYAYTSTRRPQVGNPHFSGYYAMVSWALTGETAPVRPFHGRLRSDQPGGAVLVPHGGCGAWEVAARYSNIDLTSAAVQGGKFDRLSGALSWRPTDQVRLEFNYGYGRLDRDGRRAAAPTSTSSACSSSCRRARATGASWARAAVGRGRHRRRVAGMGTWRWPGPTRRRCPGCPGTASCPRARR